jgi:hypothetical protein
VAHRLSDCVDWGTIQWMGGTRVRRLHLLEHFGPHDGDAAWGVNAQFHALAIDGEHSDSDVIPNQKALFTFAAQDEHA